MVVIVVLGRGNHQVFCGRFLKAGHKVLAATLVVVTQMDLAKPAASFAASKDTSLEPQMSSATVVVSHG